MRRMLPFFAMVLSAGDHGFGPVTPVAVPDVWATRQDGERVRLRELLQGRRTAVQFVFIDCTTACPLLGSLFGKVDRALGDNDAQLLSITVNPERDTAGRMREWLGGFRASARWHGLRVEKADLGPLLRVFGEKEGPPTGHTLQVFLVDERANYYSRTVALPSAAAVAAELRLGALPLDGERTAAASGAGREIFDGRGGLTARVGVDRLDARAARCSGCHGAEGEGGGEGKTVVPALRGDALPAARPRRGGPASAYSEAAFCQSLRTGLDPAGVQFSSMMPRYEIDGRSCRALWDFLTGSAGAR